jgi:phage terminase large subunit
MAGPYDQLFGDCNPTTPHHWLKKRCDGGKCRLYESKHHENPRYYDRHVRRWTPAGERYVNGRLRQMTGTRRKRFLLGLWAAAEGVVYAYDADIHSLPRGWKPPPHWVRVWSIDWGKTSPTVLQMWAVDPLGRMYLYREFFRTNTRPDLLGKWAKGELEAGREPHPLAIVCDHDQERKADFEKASELALELADKADRDKGIEATQARFDCEVRADGTAGQPRIFFVDEALAHEPDPNLEERGTPSCTVAELVEYRWDEDFLKDEPVDENDHGMDAMRYACRYVDAHNIGVADDYVPDHGDSLTPDYMR